MSFLVTKTHAHNNGTRTYSCSSEDEAKEALIDWLCEDAVCQGTYRHVGIDAERESEDEPQPAWFQGEGIYGASGTSSNDIIALFDNIDGSPIRMGSYYYSYHETADLDLEEEAEYA